MSKRVFVAGHKGMVGSAIVRYLETIGHQEIITKEKTDLDLLDQQRVFSFLKQEKIDQIYLAAARVGGIYANNVYPADFIFQNLTIQNNVIHGAHLADVQSVLFLGSSCIYPKFTKQPMSESALLSGELEPTNEPYAIAKIAGIKMCESYRRQYLRDYRSVMPTNLYGPGDNFHPINSHVIPGLMRKFRLALEQNQDFVEVWGTGQARREFLYVEDLAEACVYLLGLDEYMYWESVTDRLSHVNIGTGEDVKISKLVSIMQDVTGYTGSAKYDTSKPDGTPRKLLDTSLMTRFGWRANTDLKTGLEKSWAWYIENVGL